MTLRCAIINTVEKEIKYTMGSGEDETRGKICKFNAVCSAGFFFFESSGDGGEGERHRRTCGYALSVDGKSGSLWGYRIGGELTAPAAGPGYARLGSAFFRGGGLLSYVINECRYVRLSDLAASLRLLASCDDGADAVETPVTLTETWSAPVMIENSVGVSGLYLSFITPEDGWLVIGNFHRMGNEDNFIYKTVNGGRTWTQTGNSNGLYARVLTGAGFADDQIGFLGFRFEFSDFSPAVCRTLDGGRIWEKLDLRLPLEFDAYYSKTPLPPAFNGTEGVSPILLRADDAAGTTQTVLSVHGRFFCGEGPGLNRPSHSRKTPEAFLPPGFHGTGAIEIGPRIAGR